MRTWILTCAAVAAATIASALAAADEIDWLKKGANMIDWQNCRGDDADKINAGCTRIIEDSFLQPEAHAFAYLRRGMAWDEKRDRVRAIADYSESIRLNPKDDVAYGNRGLARHNSGDLEGAILDYTEAIHLDPEDAAGIITAEMLGANRATSTAP